MNNKLLLSFIGTLWKIQPGWMTLKLGMTIIGQLLPLAQLVLAQRIIDAIVAASTQQVSFEESWPAVLTLTLIESALFLINALLGRLHELYDGVYRDRFRPKLVGMILEKTAALDVGSFDNPELYNRVARLQDDSYWRPVAIYRTFFDTIAGLTTLAGSIGLFLLLPYWIVLLLIVATVPTFMLHTRYGQARWQLDERYKQDHRRAGHYAWDLTHRYNIKDIKLYRLEGFFITRFRDIWHRYHTDYLNMVHSYRLIDTLASTATIAVRAGIMIWLSIAALTGAITIGQLTLYANLIGQLAGAVRGVLLSLANLFEQAFFVKSFHAYLNTKPSIPEAAKPKRLSAKTPARVTFENVSFKYPNQSRWTLRNLNFTIEPGEHIALVGENGAGKTTIVKLLARFYDPSEGRILINDVDIRDYKLADLHQFLGIMFQDYAQFQAVVRENIAFGQLEKHKKTKEIELAASRSGAAGFVKHLPEQYDTMLSLEFDKGVELSGGQWQKIGLARTFLRDARLFVLDEPTAALDAQSEEFFYRQFLKMKADVSAILISHRFSTVRMADKIFVLEHGRIIESGSHKELMKLKGEYAKLFSLQAERYR